MNITEDRQIIATVLDGNREAYGVLVQKYQDRLYHSLLCVLGNPDDAMEITQEAFVQAMINLGKFRGESAFYTWLYRIALNMASSLRRKKTAVSFDNLVEKYNLSPEDSVDAPDRNMELLENQQMVWKAIDRVSPDFRQVLILREIEGFDYETIASILNIKIGTVRSRLFRARIQLTEFLEALENDHER